VLTGVHGRVQSADEVVEGSGGALPLWAVGRVSSGLGGGGDEETADVAELVVGVGGPAAQQLERGIGVDPEPAHQDAFGLLDDWHRLQPTLQMLIIEQQLLDTIRQTGA
jgi:hypothetical protein